MIGDFIVVREGGGIIVRQSPAGPPGADGAQGIPGEVTAAQLADETTARADADTAINSAVSGHGSATTLVHGIADTSALATMAYADSVASGLSVKNSVRLATAAALPTNTRSANVLTASANGALTVDGSVVVVGNRMLVKDEATGANNGIYDVTTVGTTGTPFVLTRSSDADTSGEVTTGIYTFVVEGSTNASTGWVLVTPAPITLDTTALTFSQFSGAADILAGTGLTKAGNTISFAADMATQAEQDTLATFLNAAIAAKQPADTDLTSIAGLVSAAGKGLHATGSGTWALHDLNAWARDNLLGVANAAAALSAIGAAATGDSRFPSAGEKAALAGTSGTPGSGNKYVTQQAADAQPVIDTTGLTAGDSIHWDGTQFVRGGSTASNPHCRVYNSAAISIPDSAFTALTFNTERWDNNAIHSTSSNTGRLTCQSAGLYAITLNISFAGNVTGIRIARVLLNSGAVGIAQDARNPLAVGATAISLTTQYRLSVGDYVYPEAYQSSGGALNVLASLNISPEFSMALIST